MKKGIKILRHSNTYRLGMIMLGIVVVIFMLTQFPKTWSPMAGLFW